MHKGRNVYGGTEDHTWILLGDRKDRKSGAYHIYDIYAKSLGPVANILFQKGPIQEVGANGCSNEDLLAIVADRLECFQRGKFACSHNARALSSIRGALLHLNKRTADRKKRGVEGKNIA
jgi:hypothetical protein